MELKILQCSEDWEYKKLYTYIPTGYHTGYTTRKSLSLFTKYYCKTDHC